MRIHFQNVLHIRVGLFENLRHLFRCGFSHSLIKLTELTGPVVGRDYELVTSSKPVVGWRPASTWTASPLPSPSFQSDFLQNPLPSLFLITRSICCSSVSSSSSSLCPSAGSVPGREETVEQTPAGKWRAVVRYHRRINALHHEHWRTHTSGEAVCVPKE